MHLKIIFNEASWYSESALKQTMPQFQIILNSLGTGSLSDLMRSQPCVNSPPAMLRERCADINIILGSFFRLRKAKSIKVRLPRNRQSRAVNHLSKELQLVCVAYPTLLLHGTARRPRRTIVSFKDKADNC